MHLDRYHVLDGLRGIAAIFVLMRHSANFWSGVAFHHSYLAVDLFFVLSGFVIVHAYDDKIVTGGMTFRQFVLVRLIRLYPMFLFASLICFASALGPHAIGQPGAGNWSDAEIALAVLLTLSFLPSRLPETDNSLFPLNSPCWSLFFELVVNFLYAGLCHRITGRTLAGVIGLAGAGLVIGAVGYGSLDLGFTWSLHSVVGGLLRSLFGFAMGILMFRLTATRRFDLSPAASTVLSIVLMVAVLSFPDVGAYNALVDLLAVAVIFPACVLFGANASRTDRPTRIMTTLGVASYPTYVLHMPVCALVVFAAERAAGIPVADYAPFSGILLVAFVIAISVLLDRTYDWPVRRALTRLAMARAAGRSKR